MSRVASLSKLRQERMREINLQNKERERMREQERATRDREARYSNGHLFISLTVSGTTFCSACNKSITAKEALSCPTCSATIHNRCRETLPNCVRMKQRRLARLKDLIFAVCWSHPHDSMFQPTGSADTDFSTFGLDKDECLGAGLIEDFISDSRASLTLEAAMRYLDVAAKVIEAYPSLQSYPELNGLLITVPNLQRSLSGLVKSTRPLYEPMPMTKCTRVPTSTAPHRSPALTPPSSQNPVPTISRYSSHLLLLLWFLITHQYLFQILTAFQLLLSEGSPQPPGGTCPDIQQQCEGSQWLSPIVTEPLPPVFAAIPVCPPSPAFVLASPHKHQKINLKNNNPLRKTPGMQERPTSACYPSDHLQQSLLGSCRGRPSLSSSKSVSTNNIAGNMNDDSSLGRNRILSQSTDSLNIRVRAVSMESLSGYMYYSSALEEFQLVDQDFKADSWSMAVDWSYLQTHRKKDIKRQEVIYELIQTELHYMQTLCIMEKVFRQGMLDQLQLEPEIVHTMFPRLDQLTRIHSHFLAQLLLRRKDSLQSGSSRNFTIHQLGDILLKQFSGSCADDMRMAYSEFCSRYLKAVKVYKELLAKDKSFQFFIQGVRRGPLLRCHGVKEYILLVTRRLSKYPALIQRILENTYDNEEEAASLVKSLSLVKELLTSINKQIEELEKTQRLQEIQAKLDPWAEARVWDGAIFRPEELQRRKLIYEGTLFWKNPGSRLKDIQVLLLTDILVFLQEKDQRYIFPCLDRPPVLSLQNLMVRDIVGQERGIILISDSSPPEIYEFYAACKDDRNVWIAHIQHTVSKCPSREEFPLIENEHKAYLRRLKVDLQQKDHDVLELLQERMTLFCELAEVTTGQGHIQPSITRCLFRADTPQAPRAEQLLLDATAEVNGLSKFLMDSSLNITSSDRHHQMELVHSNDKGGLINGGLFAAMETYQILLDLSFHLHGLMGAVIKQDSILEQQLHSVSPTPTAVGRLDGKNVAAKAGSVTRELALLQRQHSFLQEELQRLKDAENCINDGERARPKLEGHAKAGNGMGWDSRQHEKQAFQPGEEDSTRGKTFQTTRRCVHQSSFQRGSDVEVEMTSDDDGSSESTKD
ncbi:rho guanine nucleotide exchange factor 2 [Pholidichthys leucotaenia]